MSQEREIYLGDGVYLGHDGYHLILTTADASNSNKIYLEPHMLSKISNYLSEKQNSNDG